MLNLRKVMLCILVLPFVFSLIPSGAMGQEGCIVPTIPRNVEGIETYLVLQWSPANPDEIQPGTFAEVKVTGGFLPLAWSVSGSGFSLGEVQTSDRANTLQASSTACGTATITVTDALEDTETGYVRSTSGGWVLKGRYCGLSGRVTQCASGPGTAYFALIVGGKRQLQTTVKTAGGTRACDEVAAGCESMLGYYCPEFGTDNCIDGNPGHEFPYYIEEVGGGACYYRCYCVADLAYYEWECEE